MSISSSTPTAKIRQITPASRAWVEDTIHSRSAYGVSELVLSGFIRVVTHPKVFERPTPLAVALDFVNQIRRQPHAVPIRPGPRHWAIVDKLLCAMTPQVTSFQTPPTRPWPSHRGATGPRTDKGFLCIKCLLSVLSSSTRRMDISPLLGCLSSHELKEALQGYGRTLIALPDEAFRLVEVYPVKGQNATWAVDVPLWTAEEGRSDLTLSLTVSDSRVRGLSIGTPWFDLC